MSAPRDVVVAGGGPAGSALALQIARAGYAVTIVERARFPRHKACGEYLAAGALSALERLGLSAAVGREARSLAGVRLFVGHAGAVELPFPEPAGALARERLDALLLEAAAAAGAEVVQARFEEVVFEAERAAGVRVRDANDETRTIRAHFVAGADGAGSAVARKLGLHRPARGRPRFAIGGHYAGFGDLDGYVEMHVDAGAYFAINPLGPNLANVMLVVGKSEIERWRQGSAFEDAVRAKAAALGREARSLDGAVRAGPRMAIGPLRHEVRSRVAPGALLAGDAAGFLDPFSGQGVYLALAGAERAAAALLESLAHPEREQRVMAAYDRTTARDMAVRARLVAIVDALIDVPFLARRAATRLRRAPSRGRALLAALSGMAPPASGLHPRSLAGLLL